MLFGKPLLEEFGILHDYRTDELILPIAEGGERRIQNQHGYRSKTEAIFLLLASDELHADGLNSTDTNTATGGIEQDIPKKCKALIDAINNANPRKKFAFDGIFAAFKTTLQKKPSPRTWVEEIPDAEDPRIPSVGAIGRDESCEDYPFAGIFSISETAPPERRIPRPRPHNPDQDTKEPSRSAMTVEVEEPNRSATAVEIEDEDEPRRRPENGIRANECLRRFPVGGVFSIHDERTKDSGNNLLPEQLSNSMKTHPMYPPDPTKAYTWAVLDDPGAKIPEVNILEDPTLLCRTTDPFNLKRVEHLKSFVEIGPDLESGDRSKVMSLVGEFADMFALSIMEVTPVEGAAHTLNIPEGKMFGKKIHQRPLRAPERAYYYPRIDEMERARVIRKIRLEDVK